MLGASFGNVKTDFNAPVAFAVTDTGAPGAIATNTFGFAGSDRTYPSGFIGGGQIGYNWEFSPIWVAGLEADFQGAVEKDSSTLTKTSVGASLVAAPVGPSSVL
jgi:outer membrane immunogenic protein